MITMVRMKRNEKNEKERPHSCSHQGFQCTKLAQLFILLKPSAGKGSKGGRKANSLLIKMDFCCHDCLVECASMLGNRSPIDGLAV